MGLCDNCYYKEICTRHAQELAKKQDCVNYEDEDYAELGELESGGENGNDYWLEMSWYKYKQ